MIRRSERGSVFTVLLGALAISAALSVATYQLMTGPVASMSRLTKKTAADTQMLTVSKIVIMDAVNQTTPDCDSDNSIEPKEWRATAGGKPTNGGLIPLTIGAPVTDPWNTDYGYCVWDVGSFNDPAVDNGCGAGALRLLGSPNPIADDATTQTVLAIISAGPNRAFSTTCNAYVDGTTDLITTSGDDIVLRYTYQEAAAATDSLWTLQAGNPDVAEITKDLEIKSGGGATGLITAVAANLTGKLIANGGLQSGDQTTVTTCDAGNTGLIRYNTTPPGLDVCDGTAWSNIGGGAADTFTPDSMAIDCAEDVAPADGTSDHIGEVRYNTTTEVPEFCDGTGWRPFVLAIPGVNLVLSPASATMDVDGATNEDPVTCSVAGWNCGLETTFTLNNTGSTTSDAPVVALTNTTNFVITSDTCTANTLDANETCTVIIRPKANGNLTYTGNLTITANNNPFATLQGTATGFGCTPGRTGGGGIYAACNQDDADGSGAYDLIIMPSGCDGTTTNPTCSGNDTAAIKRAWGPSGYLSYICEGNDHSCKGAKQAVNLVTMQTMGYGTFGAAAYCDAMDYGGKTDWYLPNQYELQSLIYPQKSAGNLTGFLNDYYSSSNQSYVNNYNAIVRVAMSTGSDSEANGSRAGLNYIRCVRRDDLALPSATADTTPTNVSFPMSVTTSSGARTSSDAVAVTGFLQPVTVTVTSSTGTPKVKINGGAEADSGTLTAINQTVQLVMDAPVVAGTKNTMTLTIGPDSYTWYVGYADGAAGEAIVFLTSQDFSGDGPGLAGMDAQCQSAAIAAGYSGTWYAIISDSMTSASSRIPFNWSSLKRPDGVVVANNWADLWDGTIQNPINVTETGTTVNKDASGNTLSNGGIYSTASSSSNCYNWTTNSNLLFYGGNSGNTSSQWISGATINNCGHAVSLYCISTNPGTDTTPTDFTIPYAIQVPTSTLTTSDPVTIAGLGSGVNATVTITGASGSPGFNVNGVPGTSGVTTVANGDELELFLTSAAAASTSYTMTVTVGDGSTVTWRVWTGDPTGTAIKRVFVLDNGSGGNLGGLNGADSKCTTAATSAGLGGSWKAILSGDLSIESEWAINRIGYNWSELQTVTGTTVVYAPNIWETSVQPLLAPINITAAGATLNTSVATNTTSTGKASHESPCSDWTSGSNYAGNHNYGTSSGTGTIWTATSTSEDCRTNVNESEVTYCIEQ